MWFGSLQAFVERSVAWRHKERQRYRLPVISKIFEKILYQQLP